MTMDLILFTDWAMRAVNIVKHANAQCGQQTRFEGMK